jgi:multidrug efflux pump subunit AcrA (membrane-fusion protein)
MNIADLQTLMAKISFQKDERFRKGDIHVLLDCRQQRASLATAEAQLLEMRLTLDQNKTLQRLQAVGKNELAISEA